MATADESDALEFTLEDTYDLLKDLKNERELEIQNLIDKIKNTEISGLNSNITPEEINENQNAYINNLQKCIKEDIPSEYPLPNTNDIDESLIDFLDQEIQFHKDLVHKLIQDTEELNRDIKELNKKTEGVEKMKEVYLSAKDHEEAQNYTIISNHIYKIFREVKEDLSTVVHLIFPDNGDFEDLFADIVRAFPKGGDDVYVEVKPEFLDCVTFLEEMDLVAYHPYDKNLVKLVDLL